MMGQNRRRSERIPVGFYVEQLIDDDAHRCFTTDLSALGIYLERVAAPLQRSSSVVQLEIPLPDTGETLWAKGEIIYDRFDLYFHGSAIRFAGMARAHQRLLRDWLWQARREPAFSRLPVQDRRSVAPAHHAPPGFAIEHGALSPALAVRTVRVRRPGGRRAHDAAVLSSLPALPGSVTAAREPSERKTASA